ncbi:MAG: Hsp70 family protein [Thermodesulfobacteriota bacterium]
MPEPTYVVGIDLGTTNSVVAYTLVEVKKGEHPEVRLFAVPQLVAAGSLEEREEGLPSFLLLPGGHDTPASDLALPWDKEPEAAVGVFARDRGAEIPDRLVSSSKSWLCHQGVDRTSKILPWKAPEDVSKMSPVEASAAVLRHIRLAWDYKMASEDESLALANQEVVLTVPASFDPVARELTVQAAELAGLPHVTLLEEPQAAFYAWIQRSGEEWREKVGVGDLVLVCDVGGGTSDFSLIAVGEKDGDLTLERMAVGDHLLVGGDNMDLTLAYFVAKKLSADGKKLDSWQIRGLWQSLRSAKERLLSDPKLKKLPVTVLGRGSSLIGGAIKTEITREEAAEAIVDGFFPACEKDARPAAPSRAGVRELGLAYESDPAITLHMAGFLGRPGRDSHEPTAVLFNGGVMKAPALRERVLSILSGWTEKGGIRELQGADFDLAVARGAAYYGLARRGNAVRIRGGLAKSYYIGVEMAMPAVPGMPAPTKALCVAPFGMEEGTEASLDSREFGLVVGEPVRFDFLGSATRMDDKAGDTIEDWQDELSLVTTLETELTGEQGALTPVTLHVQVTEVGTLDLSCVSVKDGRKWKLSFNVREQSSNND